MIFVQTDDGLKGPFETEAVALDSITNVGNIEAWHDVKVTPEIITAQRYDGGYSVPFSMDGDRWKQLEDLEMMLEVPITEIAVESVKAEIEGCISIDGSVADAPGDVTPLESDRHIDQVERHIRERVDDMAFEAAGCKDVYDEFVDRVIEDVEAKIMDYWNDDGLIAEWEEEILNV